MFITAIDCFHDLVIHIFLFWAVFVHNSHIILIIVKNCRWRQQIEKFWYCFAISFQIIFAVLTRILFGRISNLSKIQSSCRKVNPRKIPIYKIQFMIEFGIENHNISVYLYFFLLSTTMSLKSGCFFITAQV